MRVGLHDSDKTRFPNLALMKLAAWHRSRGDEVEWFLPIRPYDRVYSSKVFSWTEEDAYLPAHAIKGGTGRSLEETLPDAIEHICPAYDIYPAPPDYSLGFLTRGCPRACAWCVVPAKEGPIREHARFEEFVRHKSVRFLDNNVLAHPHGLREIERLAATDIKVDFNQGLDARLVCEATARLLSRLRWTRYIRFACDTASQMGDVEEAVSRLRAAGGRYREYFAYVLIADDVEDAVERVEFLRALKVTPFAQPLRMAGSTARPPALARNLARYVNHKATFSSVSWREYLAGKRQTYELKAPA